MGRWECNFQGIDRCDPVESGAARQRMFEIYVGEGFTDTEIASVVHTLQTANDLMAELVFSWRCVSEMGGYVKGKGGMIVDTLPAHDDGIPPHTLIVVGGPNNQSPAWMRRMRVLQRKALPVVLLSEAATLYIQNANPSGKVTTHWRDVAKLEETGHYPQLTTRLSEKANGVITAAGGASTSELIIGLISPLLTSERVAELGNRLLLGTIRKSHADQPKDIADNTGLFDLQITQVLRLMEDRLADPLPMTALAREVGISTRQLERTFRAVLKETPARFYKRLRAKRARAMIEETLLPVIDVAVATGFGSNCSLSKALKAEYGMTASKMRERKAVNLLHFEKR